MREALSAWAAHLGEEVADAGALRAQLTAGTLTEALHAPTGRRGDRPALTVGGETATHAELDARAARAGGWLRDQGVRPGDRVLLAAPTSVALVVAYLGVLRARGAVVPADPGATAAELAHLREDSGAVLALVDGARTDGTGLGALAQGAPLEAQSEGEDLAMLAYTSGTTGRPKGVPLTHAQLLASQRAALRAWAWQEDDVLVHALPLSHQHGLTGVQMALQAGSRAVVLPRFDPAALCRAVAAERATVLFAVPAMYDRLLAWEGLAGADLGSLRLWVSGSAPLSPDLARRVEAVLGAAPLERYGSTETGLSVSQPLRGPRRAGTVGLPLPGLELALLERGEIALRGPQVFGGYWRRPAGEGFTADGWFRTGDLGRLDDDGALRITGRLKELIVSGGMNVEPREVELALEEHAAVRRAAVVGVPSERWGEEVVAFVAGDGAEPDPDELTAHVRERLSAFKVPKRVLVVEELPMSETGKVRRAELVERARNEEATR